MQPCVCALGSRFSDSAEAKCGNLLEQVMDCSLGQKEGQAVQCFIKWTETFSMVKKLKIYRGIKCTEDKIFHMLYRHCRVRQYHIHPPTPHLLAMKEHCEYDLAKVLLVLDGDQ